ncbi:MarR family transcriptional regulator [Micromonospora sp. DT233]|uniref:MarR family winged helix-turn-helix transcriptional regulator n=1 Tax=Micromonospora sp. DT233 TaxID=3393432 RepID=UPI003CE96E89
MAAALDAAAGTLLSVFEAARESTTSRLSGAQLRAVMAVEQHDGINLRRLATLLDMLLSSASRLCDRLVAAGMLEREPGRSDRRVISLHLTPEAEQLLAELRADRQERLAAVLAGMTPEGRRALLAGIREFDEAARRRHPPEPPRAEHSGQTRAAEATTRPEPTRPEPTRPETTTRPEPTRPEPTRPEATTWPEATTLPEAASPGRPTMSGGPGRSDDPAPHGDWPRTA